jgi:hypothetical protein
MRARVIVAAQLTTLAAVRTYLHLYPNSDFNVGGFNVHHLFTGLLLLVGCAIPLALNHRDTRQMRFVAAGFGAGVALTLDEWLYLIVTDGSNASYLLPVSLAGSLALNALAAAYVLRYGAGARDSRQNASLSIDATGATVPHQKERNAEVG